MYFLFLVLKGFMRNLLYAIAFFSACLFGFQVQAKTLPQNEFIYVQYKNGFCPDGHCELIFHKIGPTCISGPQDYCNYEIFASHPEMNVAPDFIEYVKFTLVPDRLVRYLKVWESGAQKYYEFYPAVKVQGVSYSPIRNTIEAIGYDNITPDTSNPKYRQAADSFN